MSKPPIPPYIQPDTFYALIHVYPLPDTPLISQGDERIQGAHGTERTGTPAAPPEAGGPGKGGACHAGQGQVHLDHGGWAPGALDSRLMRLIHRAVELQVRVKGVQSAGFGLEALSNRIVDLQVRV